MNLDFAKIEEVVKRLEAKAPDYTKKIPAPVLYGLHQYIASGRGTGHFLEAVLEDRLFEAVAHADNSSLEGIRELVQYIYNRLPSGCYGSREKVDAWREAGGLVGQNMVEEKEDECLSTQDNRQGS